MSNPTNTYTQGHSASTLSAHALRTASNDAGFLLPHLKPTDKILDIGCGPGSITLGLAAHAPQGLTVGVDLTETVLQKARDLASSQGVPVEGPGSCRFEIGNVLEGLKQFEDETFDVVFASQVFGHLTPAPDVPLRAMAEVMRVLKTGGVFADRESAMQHVFPQSLGMDHIFFRRQRIAMATGEEVVEPYGGIMPGIVRQSGFSGKMIVGANPSVAADQEAKDFLANRLAKQLTEEGEYRNSWLKAGIPEEEIRDTVEAVRSWAKMEGAWYVSVNCEVLAWK